MKYKPYPKYKATNIEWLGEIPEKWNVVRLRFIFTIKKRIAGSLGHDILSITQQGIKIKDIESNEGQNSQDYSKYQIVEVGDFAMNHMDLLTGFVDISKYVGVTSPDYRVFALNNTITNDPQYFLQIFQMCYLQKIFYPFGQGASQFGRWRLPTEAFKDFWYPVPTLSIQKRIINFLNTEATRIDSLVVDYEELIALLQEKWQSLISHAVTRGISELVNADDIEFGEWAKPIKFKDSGIEWLGAIPDEWTIFRLRHIVKVNPSKITCLNKPEKVSFFPMDAIGTKGELDFSQTRNWEDVETGYTFFMEGDVVYAIITPCFENGKGALIHGLENSVGFGTTELTVLRPSIKVNGKWLWYVTLSNQFRKLGEGYMYGAGGQKRVPDDYARNFSVGLPCISCQENIVRFLDRETSKIDILIKEAQDATTLLKEHRSALIMNVVTGKINVEETA